MKAKSAATDAAADAALVVPVSTIAHALDLTTRRVQQLVAEDVLPKEERGRYPLIPVVRAYIAHLKATPEIPAGNLDPSQERARKDRALAISAEIKNDIATGRVVLIDDAIAIMTGGLSRVRNKILSLASRVAPRLVMQREAEPIRALLYDELVAILEELSVEHDVQRLAGESAASEAA
ncbi:hypothetical protein [Methylobacterium sp. WL7]|uniref:hypothetical protein n=1 Tax=Methylobacterium sp. WL7 TaxID=2603900 RepID=UPI0011C85E2B|nr:hypothetical protein [Methylobacterium sp. WL7]TXN41380.1 hypothetical protein FV233_25260 [Methylobacterium sp. WL7]